MLKLVQEKLCLEIDTEVIKGMNVGLDKIISWEALQVVRMREKSQPIAI